MISQKLQTAFQLIEMTAFEQWKKADKKGKEKIARDIGELEAKLIIKEIEEEATLKFGKV